MADTSPRPVIDDPEPGAPIIERLGHQTLVLHELVAEVGNPDLETPMRNLMIAIGRVIAAEMVRRDNDPMQD